LATGAAGFLAAVVDVTLDGLGAAAVFAVLVEVAMLPVVVVPLAPEVTTVPVGVAEVVGALVELAEVEVAEVKAAVEVEVVAVSLASIAAAVAGVISGVLGAATADGAASSPQTKVSVVTVAIRAFALRRRLFDELVTSAAPRPGPQSVAGVPFASISSQRLRRRCYRSSRRSFDGSDCQPV
jgi:hypothetical protein